MGMVDGPNMYAYARNDPMNHRDPSGCMSVPPSLVNGGGGGVGGTGDQDLEECPGSGYETYNDCVSAQHGTPPAGYDSVAEYCNHICYEQESRETGGSSGGGLPEPPAGAECDINYIESNEIVIGYDFYCNQEASTYLAEWCALAGGLSLVLSKFFAPLISISIACGAFSAHVAFCSLFFDAGVRYTQIANAPPVPTCYSE